MPLFTRVSGTWRTVTSPRVRVSGTWRTVTGIWTRVSGTWRQVYQNVTAFWAGTFRDPFAFSSAPSVGVGLNRNGTGFISSSPGTTDNYTWVAGSSTVGDGYDVRFTWSAVAGVSVLGAVSGTWYQLNATRSVTISGPNTSVYTRTQSVTITVRTRAGLATVASGTLTAQLSREV